MSSKKAAKSQAAEINYQIKDIVLAKVKGYPPWPAMVVDPESVAKNVKKERPNSKKTVFYCVRFFPAGDFSWAVAKDMSRLLTHEIEAYINEPSKKNTELKRGYEIALNPGPWEEELVRKQEEADAAAAEEEEGVDQLDGESDGEDEVESDADSTAPKKKKKSQAGKKRKRDTAAPAVAEDKQKKRKSVSEPKRRPLAGTKKASKTKASSTEQIESEDGGAAGDGDESADASTKKAPVKGSKSKSADDDSEERAAKRGKKDKEDDEVDELSAQLANDPEAQRVKEWRHKLQRGFLSKEPPNPSEMPVYDQIFQTVESKDLTIDYLQYSKIGKVMRRIASSNDVPRDDEFKFKDRATALVHKWQAIIQAAEQEAGGATKQANGTTADKASSKSPPAETAPEPKDDPKPVANGTANGASDADMANGANGAAPAVEAAVDDDKADAMDTSDS